jgi:uncharacterized LabA/DUF88 family protein
MFCMAYLETGQPSWLSANIRDFMFEAPIMNLSRIERTAFFIDGNHLYAASRNLGFEVDYRDLLKYFQEQSGFVRAHYYSAVIETEAYTPLKPLIDWLAYNGYTVVTKTVKDYTDATGRRRVRTSMDVEIAVDMLELSEVVSTIVVIAGEGTLRRAIEAVQRRGVKVVVISSLHTTPLMASDELRRQCDAFIELADIAPKFTRRLVDPRTVRTSEAA